MHLAQRLWFGGAALALTAVLTIADTGPVYAQKKNVPTPDPNGQLTQALQTIHATRIVLENADHDYGGHRAAAVKALGGAQHQLRLALGIKGVKGPKTPKSNPMPEAQALSDMQLAQAIPVLKQTITTMNNASNDYRGHRADAVRDLNEAISQLEKALKYRKDKDEKKSS
jgi:hypothetical protein